MYGDRTEDSDRKPFNIEDFDKGFKDAIMPRSTVTAKGNSKLRATRPYASLSPFPVDTKATRERERERK